MAQMPSCRRYRWSWGGPSDGVQPLEVSSFQQLVAAGWSVLSSDDLYQQPEKCIRLDGGGGDRLAPELARIL